MFKITKTMLTEEEIKARVAELGKQIEKDFEGQDLLVVGILKGASVFVADLIRNIKKFIDLNYSNEEVIKAAEELSKEALESKVIVKDDDIDDIKNAPIVKMIEYMFKNSIEMRASDIHIEPYEKEVRIRYRIDGELSTVNLIGIESLPPLVARIKILAGLNIAEKRIP